MYTTEGFVNAMAEFGGVSVRDGQPAWKVERRGGVIRFRMTCGI